RPGGCEMGRPIGVAVRLVGWRVHRGITQRRGRAWGALRSGGAARAVLPVLPILPAMVIFALLPMRPIRGAASLRWTCIAGWRGWLARLGFARIWLLAWLCAWLCAGWPRRVSRIQWLGRARL